MLWFQPLPWGRWLLVGLVAVGALYLEFRPDPSIETPYALVDLTPGSVLDEANSEMRRIPTGLFEGADLGDVTREPVSAGEPVLASDVSEQSETIPLGWWVVGVTLPDGADTGDDVMVVLLDTGEQVEGVVAHPGADDPFAAADGGVAIPPGRASEVAVAAANGRLAVLIATN